MPGKQNLAAHKTARRAAKRIELLTHEYLWLVGMVKGELKIQRKVLERKDPNGQEAMLARRRMIECENVLERMKKGKIFWEQT